MNIKNIRLLLITVVSATVMGSCHIYKKYDLPDEGVISKYKEALEQPVDSSALGNLQWDEIFTDPQLQVLINEALENNVDLQNAKLNVDIAHAQLLGARLSYLPSLAFAPNGSGSKVGSASLDWGYQLPLSLSWEIDIFGRILNSKRQAQVNLYQSEAYQQAVRSQIIGAVANCYYQLVSFEKQLALYNETAELWKQTVQVMRDMKEAGRYNEVAIVQSEASYYSVLAAIPQVEMSINELNNTMSLLLNVEPQVWDVNVESIVVLPSELVFGVPMSYLAARPDVRAAEYSFASAYYATNMARSAFYPNITLSANGGYGTLLGSAIVDPAQWFINLAGQLSQPLFNKGQNIANLKAAKAQQQQALNSFENAVLSASAEVSNALVTMEKSEEMRQNLVLEVEKLQKAVDYNRDLLALSTTTYLEVLTAQQSLLNSQISLLNTDLAINQAAINLYQALGGGR